MKWLVLALTLLFAITPAAAWNKHGYLPGTGAVVLDMVGISTPIFMNVLKTGGCNAYTVGDLNNDGYPQVTNLTTTVSCGATLPANIGGGNWVWGFTGEGGMELNVGGCCTLVSDGGGPLSAPSCVHQSGAQLWMINQTNAAGCYVVFHDNGALFGGNNSILYSIPQKSYTGATLTYSGMSAAYMVPQSEISQYFTCLTQYADCFDPGFLGVVSARAGTSPVGFSVNPQVGRYINQVCSSNCLLSDWSGEHDSTALSYATFPYYNNLWGGTICATSGTCASNPQPGVFIGADSPYAIAQGYSGCVNGEIYQGVVADTAPKSPVATLTVLNSAGSAARCTAPIYNWNEYGSYAITPVAISAEPASFFYDAGLNVWWYSPDGSGTHADGLPSYQPPSVIAALCSQLGNDCWIQIPTLFNDASVEAEATSIAQNLKPGLKWFVEWSNEIMGNWNYQSNWAYLEGVALNFPTTGVPEISGSNGVGEQEWDFYAYRRMQIMNDVKTAWVAAGRSLSDLVLMETNSLGDSPAVIEALRFQGYDLTFQSNGQYCSGVGCTITASYNTAPNRPIDSVITGFSYAPYINGGYFQYNGLYSGCGTITPPGFNNYFAGWTPVLQAVDNYTTGVNTNNPTLINSALNVVDADNRASWCSTTAFMATITNTAGTGPGTVLNVTSIEPNPFVNLVNSSTQLVGVGVSPTTEITALGAGGCTPAGAGGTGCYTVSVSQYIPTPELMVYGGPQQTVLYHESQYPQYDTLVAKYPQILGVWQYEGGFEDVGPDTSALGNLGMFSTPNCPITTQTGTATIAISASGTAPTSTPTQMYVTWAGTDAPIHYDYVSFSTGGGGITANTPYYLQVPTLTGAFTASITGQVMTVASVGSGAIALGDGVGTGNTLYGDINEPLDNTSIIANAGSGGTPCNGVACTGAGGVGTYEVSKSQTVTSRTIDTYHPVYELFQLGDNNGLTNNVTASISGNVINVTAESGSNKIQVGHIIVDYTNDIINGTTITGNSSSGSTACGGVACTGYGTTGTYAISNSQTVGAESMVIGGNSLVNNNVTTPQTVTFGEAVNSTSCIATEWQNLIEGYKNSALIEQLYHDDWTAFINQPNGTSKAPAQYNMGYNGTLSLINPPQWQMILGSIYTTPYYDTF